MDKGHSKDELVRAQLMLRHGQHEDLRRLGFERRQSISDLVREAVDAWLAKEKERKPRVK